MTYSCHDELYSLRVANSKSSQPRVARSGHRLFISAFMIALKLVCNETNLNKSWCVVGQGMFTLKEKTERKMGSYLEWKLNLQPAGLSEFALLAVP